MVASLIALGTAIAQFLTQKDKTKYADIVNAQANLKKEWYAEFNKPVENRDSVILDGISIQLRLNAEQLDTAFRAAASLT